MSSKWQFNNDAWYRHAGPLFYKVRAPRHTMEGYRASIKFKTEGDVLIEHPVKNFEEGKTLCNKIGARLGYSIVNAHRKR